MVTMNFGSALLVFVNFWLIALTAFGTATAAVFLYILNGVTAAISASTAVSLVCSLLTILYLVIQSIDVGPAARSRWHNSWLYSACLQFPRVLVVCWIPATAIGLWSTLRQPACESGSTVADADAWQNGLSCWVFRVMVSLTVVTLVLVLCNLIMLEMNGRRICIGLFHFDYTISERGFEHTKRYRRPNLATFNHGTSVESLASPRTITSEDEFQLGGSAEKLHTRNAYPISPSPTYRTLDLTVTRSRAPSSPSMLEPLHEEVSSFESPTSRNSTCTTLTLSSFPATPTSAANCSSIFPSSKLAARPLSASNLPALPTSFQCQVRELEAIKHKSMSHGPKPARPALCNITDTNGKIRSSSAVPLLVANNRNVDLCDQDFMAERTRSASLTEIVEKPPPAWCSDTKLKSMPLSADPAIKKLTDLRRSSKLGIGFDRMSRRISLSGFEFGFGGNTRAAKIKSRIVDEEAGEQNLNAKETLIAAKNEETLPPASNADTESSKIRQEDITPAKKTMERNHPIRGAGSGNLTRAKKSLSIMPPPVPDRATGHSRGQSEGRKHTKSVVERGRYEKLSR